MGEDLAQDQFTRSYAEAVELDARAAETLRASAAEGVEAVDPCAAWRRIRPIVEAASNLFFIPANIRRVLKELIGIVDGFCPG